MRVLGIGGVRALRAMGLDPAVFHFNEGHPALAAFELLAEGMAAGLDRATAWDRVRSKVVFTTHTPVPAGNEYYSPEEILECCRPSHNSPATPRNSSPSGGSIPEPRPVVGHDTAGDPVQRAR